MASGQNKMLYCNLGRSGLKVSKIIVGCMSYGDPGWQGWVLPEAESLELLEHAYKKGIRTWDTAGVYSHGRSEEIVGKAIKKFNIPREELVIMTKCYFGVTPDTMDQQPATVGTNDGIMLNQCGLSRKNIMRSVKESCERLGTYIDVLQIHRRDPDTPAEEVMRALNDVVNSGQVRYIGASSMMAWQFQEMQNVAEKHGWNKFINMQGNYSLLYREEENEMIPYCHHTGVGLTPWGPVARGTLARPFDSRGTLRDQTDNYLNNIIRKNEAEGDKNIVDRVEELAKKHGKTMAQIAVAWACSKKDVCPIVGFNKKERIEEAIEAIHIKLSEEDIKYLEEPYAPKRRQGF